MVIRINNQEPSDLYVGNQPVQKVYRGAGLVWSAVPVVVGDEPPSAGSGFNAPTAWSINNEQATTGDIMRLDVQSLPSEADYTVDHFELAIKRPDEIVIERVLGGPAVDYERRHRGITGTNTVWLRAVYVADSDDTAFVTGEWSNAKTVTLSSGSVRIELLASKTDLIQGEGAYLEASVYGANTLRPIHDLHYRWYVTKSGEQGSFDALPDYFTAHFDNTRTEGYGSAWAFVPKTTGSTTVYCEVRDRSGILATESITLTTTPATDVIAAANTYVVSTSGDYSGTPSGAQRFTDLESAMEAAHKGRYAEVEALIMLRAGEEFTTTYGKFAWNEFSRFVLTSYGSGERPTVRDVRLYFTTDTVVIHNINFQSHYDPTDPMNMPNLGMDGLTMSYAVHGTVSDCRLAGYSTAMNIGTSGHDTIVSNVEITDWGNFGIHQGDTGIHALIGCYIHQNPRAWRGRGKTEKNPPFLPDHGPFRSSRPDANRVFSKVVAFSCNSWTSGESVQPTFRFFGSGMTDKPYRTLVSEMITEGGNFALSVTSASSGNSRPTPQDIVVDKFVHLPTTQPLVALGIAYGGTTLRNFILVLPDVRLESGSGTRHMISLDNSGQNVGNQDNVNHPIVVENGSLIDLRDADSNNGPRDFSPFFNGGAKHPFNDVTYRNMLEYAPDMPEGVTDTAPLELAALWTPEYIGQFIWDVGTPDYSFATPPESTASFKPQSGSSAYKSASGEHIPVDDLRGTLRNGATSKGAFH